MTDKVTLTNISTFVNDSSAATTYNNNLATITSGFDNTLSLNGLAPNQMQANLDMNSFQILNLPPPGTVNSPARLADVVTNPTITVPAVGTSGATVPYLNGTNTWSGQQTFNSPVIHGSTETFNGATTFNSSATFVSPLTGSAIVTGTNLATNTVTNSNIRQSVGVSVVGNSTSSTANVADITGTANQVLVVNSGGTGLGFGQVNLGSSFAVTGVLPAVNGGSQFVLLNTLTPSAVATASDTTSLTATYSQYEIQFLNIIPATTASALYLQINAGGVQATNYQSSITYAGAGAVTATTLTTAAQLSISQTSTAAYGGVSGFVRIVAPSNSTTYKPIFGSASCNNGTNQYVCNFSSLWTNATTAVTGFQFLFSAGNITSGTIKVYGII